MEYRIERLGHRGDGVAEGPLYAPLTLPGERVTGTPDGTRLRDVRILTPSDARVRPVCRHFKACGGCQVMHGSDAFVAQWKSDLVREALQAHGLEAEIRAIPTSPPHSRRRGRFAARRTRAGALAGFFGRASATIVETPDCQLLTPALREAREIALELARLGASRKATLGVEVTDSLGGLDVRVTDGLPLDAGLVSALAGLAERKGLARLTWDDDIVALRTEPLVAMGAARVCPPPGAFLQATAHGQATLVGAMVEAVGDARRVLDLFAGCGTFALPLAQTAEVHAVEGDAAMLGALDLGWRRASGLKRITTETRDLFRAPLVPNELSRYDAIVIDPPRAGALAQVGEIARAAVPVIGFVSCNPATFARDARLLCDAGYVLDWVLPVDQFRWSAHVELAARFRLTHM